MIVQVLALPQSDFRFRCIPIRIPAGPPCSFRAARFAINVHERIRHCQYRRRRRRHRCRSACAAKLTCRSWKRASGSAAGPIPIRRAWARFDHGCHWLHSASINPLTHLGRSSRHPVMSIPVHPFRIHDGAIWQPIRSPRDYVVAMNAGLRADVAGRAGNDVVAATADPASC